MMKQLEQPDPLGPLAEAFLDRYRRGENPLVEEYKARFPELAHRIEMLIPTLIMIEELAPERPMDASPSIAKKDGTLQQLGDFQILEEIGRGGMGVVYRAHQRSMGRDVALKVLGGHSLSAQALERFQLEARSAGRLHHSHIVPVFEVGQVEEVYFYTMQLIHGRALDRILDDLRHGLNFEEALGEKRSGAVEESTSTFNAHQDDSTASQPSIENGLQAVSPKGLPPVTSASENDRRSAAARAASGGPASHYIRVAELGYQTALAIAFAHEQGILHRDIKPSNLLLDSFGHLWVTDFGLAKAIEGDQSGQSAVTQTGDIVGTLRYLAPERFRGWSDPRSDVYSIGVTLYEFLTLKPAFNIHDRLALVEKIVSSAPVRPKVIDRKIPSDLETIILKAIEKEPGARYQSAAHLAEDFRCFLDYRPITARRPSVLDKLRQWARRNPVVAVLSATLSLVVLGAWSATLYLWHKAESAVTDARQHLQAEQRNLRLAIAAVDEFSSKVSGDDRLNEHDLRPLKQNLLRTAVDFHQQLLPLRDTKELARVELANSYQRLASLTAEVDGGDRPIELYERANSELKTHLVDHPTDQASRLNVVRNLGAMGLIWNDRGKPQQAEQALLEAIGLLQNLLESDPSFGEARVELCELLRRKSYLERTTNRFEESRSSLRWAIKECCLLREKQPSNSDLAISMARCHWLLGSTELESGLKNWRQAEAEYETGREIAKAVIESPNANDDSRRVYARILGGLSRVAKVSSRPQVSLEWSLETISIQQKLVRDNPSVLDLQAELALTYEDIGGAQLSVDNKQAAFEMYQQAFEIWQRLTTQGPGSAHWEIHLGLSIDRLADWDVEAGRLQQALVRYDRAVAVLQNVRIEHPNRSNVASLLAATLASRATCLERREQFDKSLLDWDWALELEPGEMHSSYRIQKAWSLVNQGNYESAIADVMTSVQKLGSHETVNHNPIPFILCARIFAKAANLAKDDPQRVDAEKALLTDEYCKTAIDFLRQARASGIDLSTLRNIAGFESLHVRPEANELFGP